MVAIRLDKQLFEVGIVIMAIGLVLLSQSSASAQQQSPTAAPSPPAQYASYNSVLSQSIYLPPNQIISHTVPLNGGDNLMITIAVSGINQTVDFSLIRGATVLVGGAEFSRLQEQWVVPQTGYYQLRLYNTGWDASEAKMVSVAFISVTLSNSSTTSSTNGGLSLSPFQFTAYGLLLASLGAGVTVAAAKMASKKVPAGGIVPASSTSKKSK